MAQIAADGGSVTRNLEQIAQAIEREYNASRSMLAEGARVDATRNYTHGIDAYIQSVEDGIRYSIDSLVGFRDSIEAFLKDVAKTDEAGAAQGAKLIALIDRISADQTASAANSAAPKGPEINGDDKPEKHMGKGYDGASAGTTGNKPV